MSLMTYTSVFYNCIYVSLYISHIHAKNATCYRTMYIALKSYVMYVAFGLICDVRCTSHMTKMR